MLFEQFIPSIALAEILKPTTTHHFGQSFESIQPVLEDDSWNEEDEGEPLPIEYNIFGDNPYNWYTQEWWNCAYHGIPIDWDGYIFRDLFTDVHDIENDYTIVDGHHLDWY